MVYNRLMDTNKSLLDIKEAAALLGVHYNTVYRWLNDGSLRGVRLGPKLWRIPRSEIERMTQMEPEHSEAV